MNEIWERHARWWQQSFTDGADPEYVEQIVPCAATWLAGFDRVLDAGCGEGQIARQVAAGSEGGRPSFVAGVDIAHNQVREAHRRGGQVSYVMGDATALPYRSAAFDAIVATLVFEHLGRLDRACAEVARVLAPGGRFVLFCNHPFIQTPGSGWIDDQVIEPPEQYWRVGPYLTESYSLEEVDRGVSIGFYHRPLSRYVNELAGVGLLIEHMIEPSPPPGFVAQAPEYEEITTLPRLLVLVTRKV